MLNALEDQTSPINPPFITAITFPGITKTKGNSLGKPTAGNKERKTYGWWQPEIRDQLTILGW